MFRIFHTGLNWEDEANSFERKDRRTDSECKIPGIEELDRWVEATHADNRGDIIPIDIGQADENKYIGEKGCASQLGDVSDVRERNQSNELNANECIDRQRRRTVLGHGPEE